MLWLQISQCEDLLVVHFIFSLQDGWFLSSEFMQMCLAEHKGVRCLLRDNQQEKWPFEENNAALEDVNKAAVAGVMSEPEFI